MHIHILGICGTFMGGLALLARELGYEVTGSDSHVYPPMSTQLETAGITLHEGYDPASLEPVPDRVIIGNALSRGNPAVEYVLDRELPHSSGPQWLAEHILRGRHVLAVAGTHGKTTTSSILAWLLEAVGLEPGFLIGGVPLDFGISARLGGGRIFVIEADEYDSAFFDKRSKFIHYRPRTLIINNIEFDHADIFRDLEDIKRQFHYLVRTVPGTGRILVRAGDANIQAVLDRGYWTPISTFGLAEAEWQGRLSRADGSVFTVEHQGMAQGEVTWGLPGEHNVENALAAIAAAVATGVKPAESCAALGRFRGIRRRLEKFDEIDGITLYDDFAHHPTAIRATLTALRRRVGDARIIAVLEPRSNTMKLGVHKQELAASLDAADVVHLYQPADLGWRLGEVMAGLGERCAIHSTTDAIIEAIAGAARSGDHVLIMSNGGFEGIHRRLAQRLGSA